jgi:hypothetical protein
MCHNNSTYCQYSTSIRMMEAELQFLAEKLIKERDQYDNSTVPSDTLLFNIYDNSFRLQVLINEHYDLRQGVSQGLFTQM